MSEFESSQQGASGLGGRDAEQGCAVCHTGNWIHVRYEYTEGDPVTDAVYVVQTPNNGDQGGTVLAEGVLTVGPDSGHDYVHVDLGDHSGEVEVFFIDDPVEPVPFEEPQPVEDTRNWLQRAADATWSGIKSGANWGWEVVQGDFNDDMSTGQIITNAIVTAVPVVDQVADVRDLVANGYKLIWEKRWNELGVWVGVFACLIGLIPSLGSLAKGVLKLVWKNAGEMGRILIYINKALHKTGMRINGYRFMKKLADEVVAQVGFVASKFDEYLDDIAAKARFFGADEVLAAVETVRGMARQKFDEVAQALRRKILDGLGRFASKAFKVGPGQSISIRRAIRVVRYDGPFARMQDDMHRIGDELAEGSVEMTAEHRRLMLEERDPRVIQQKFDAIKDDLPDEWKGKMSAEDWNKVALRNFAGAPRVAPVVPGTKMYRVVESPGQANGSWWSFSKPPDTEEAWRNRDAVRTDWNKAPAYIEIEAPPPSHVLIGTAGPKEAASDATRVHPGGGEQLYVPNFDYPADNSIFANLDKQIEETGGWYYTPWNDRAPKQAVVPRVNAGNVNECDL